MKIALFSSGFSAFQLRLQPWLTMLEVGWRLQMEGHEVCVATDGEATPETPLRTQRFPSLAGTESGAISAWLRKFAPDCAVVSVSPFSLATAGWHSTLNPRTSWAYLPYAMYNGPEMAAAWPHLGRADRWGYGRNLLVPGAVWRACLKRRFRGVICQSHRTADRLGQRINASVIPPGLDLDRWCPAPRIYRMPEGRLPFLFLGSPKAIRGFDVLLKAMALTPKDIRLRVLARGLEPAQEAEVRSRLDVLGLTDRVDVRGGWLSQEDLVREIRQAAAVVLPFVLVPSELPVSVMEVIACGTPVITTDVDGLPEAVGAGGVVVPAGDATALASAIESLATTPQRLAALRAACMNRREKYTGWAAVAAEWVRVLAATR